MKWLVAALLFLFVQSATSAEEKQGAGASFFVSNDNEGMSIRRLGLEYLPLYTHMDQLTGARYTAHQYTASGWSRSGNQLSLLYRNLVPATANGTQLELGVFRLNGNDLVTLDAGHRTALSERTGMEFFVDREWVEAPTAIDRGIHFTLGGIALDHQISQRFTVVGVGGVQNFSDGNFRNHGRARLIFQPDTDLGLTLQLRYRAYVSSSSDVGGAYFNPLQYEETMIALGWRQRSAGWTGTLVAGVGFQKINHDPESPTQLLEIGLQSPLFNKQQALRLRAGSNVSAAFNGPDYRYSYLLGEWILTL